MAVVPWHLCVVVWGDAYTKRFLDFGLPSQLTARNLGALSGIPASEYWIYTTASSEVMIRASRPFATLEKLIKVHFSRIELPSRGTNKYHAMTEAHKDALEHGRRAHAVLSFLSPDAIWSDGSFEYARDKILAGKQAVMVTGVRTQAETLLPELVRLAPLNEDGSLSVSARTLASLMVANLHATSREMLWQNEKMTNWPSTLYWQVGRAGLLVRAFHMHPFAVCLGGGNATFRGTVDDGLIDATLADSSKIEVIDDSDNMFGVEVSTHDIRPIPSNCTIPRSGRIAATARWAERVVDDKHCEYLRIKIRLHGEPLGPEWAPIERQSDDVVERIVQFLDVDSEEYLFGASLINLRADYLRMASQGGPTDRLAALVIRGFIWLVEHTGAAWLYQKLKSHA